MEMDKLLKDGKQADNQICDRYEYSKESSKESEKVSCCQYDATSHPYLTMFIVFLTLMVDAMLVTVVDPILPDLLHETEEHPNRLVSSSFLTHPDLTVKSNNATTDLERENSVKIAILVGMKPLLQVVFNVVAGFIIERYGHRNPMLIGCVFNMIATLGFGYLRNFYLLLLTRVMQAIGGSLSVVGALAFLAKSFRDDKWRLRATSFALSGFSVGIAIGFTLGSLLYQYCAIECPFLVIAGLSTLDGILRYMMLTPKLESEVGAPVAGLDNAISLLKDPLILAGLAMTFLHTFCIGFYMGTIPAWVLYTLHGQQWMIGISLGCFSVVMVISQVVTGRYSKLKTIWIPAFVSLILMAIGFSIYPVCKTPLELIAPNAITRVGHGILIACLNPMLNHIVDVRHKSAYGLMNGFYTASYNLGLGLGPNTAGTLLQVMSFIWLYWGLAIFLFLCSGIALLWRRVEPSEYNTINDGLSQANND